jgi:uncharacterized protein (TIGR02594 family)
MKLIIVKVTNFFDKPGGSIIDTMLPGDPVTSTGNASGPLIEVVIESGAKGWIAKDDCAPDSTARTSVVPAFFVDTCIGVERAFNDIASTAPWYVAADFLIARALLETKIQNVGPSVGSDAVGPLLVSSKEWQRLLAGADQSLQFKRQPDAYDDPLVQIYAGGYTMSADAKAISDAVKKKVAGAADDPFVPSYLNVLHAYFTNAETAAALLTAIDDDAARQAPVSKLFTGLDATQTAQIFANRGTYFGTALQPKTVAQFFDATGTAMDQALKDAFGLIKRFVPEALPDIKQAEAPWFDVALQQEAAHISAVDNPDVIEKKYFAATNLGAQSEVENWCAAFVAYCMKESGSPEAAASIPKHDSALAVTWGGWGTGLSVRAEDVPQGAVVVLSPSPGTNTSGHVGFCVQFLDNGKSIQLLGGNQSNRVQRSTFPATRIRAIRWLDLEPSNVRTGFQADPANPNLPISQQAIDLIVFFEVSSQALYEKKYRKPTWPGGQSGVTVAIGYDVGYTNRDQLINDWTGKIPQPMIDALEAAIGVKGSAAAPLARQLGATVDIPFQAAMSVFTGRDVPRWTKIVQSALPNCNLLNPDCLGALVSLAYNRGPSFSAAGSRYAEMRDIKAHMASRDFKLIPDDIRHMKRLWPTVPGLQTRREKEAQLFEQGLANMPVA